jgi:dTDP-4-dehydrorhamnose reductase
LGTIKHRILITGANGLLGQALVKLFVKEKIEFLATSLGVNRNPECAAVDYKSLDITIQSEVNQTIEAYLPTAIIHTAAMTNVDLCEKEQVACHLLNVRATEYLLNAAMKVEAHFQLLSTDFVFDGIKGNYAEQDEVNPLSIYAKSKVEAENLLLNAEYKNTSIVRTIIVYGKGHNLSRGNIILWGKEQLEQGKELTIVDDQFRAPTYAPDLALGCFLVIDKNETGIFHIAGPETVSIFALLNRVAKFWKLDEKLITATKSNALAQAAQRPPKTGFNLTKAYDKLEYKPKTLEESFSELN